MRLLILLLLTSCAAWMPSHYDGKFTANMYAAGYRAGCLDAFDDGEKCEKVYWMAYCRGNVGEPDMEKCSRKDKWEGMK